MKNYKKLFLFTLVVKKNLKLKLSIIINKETLQLDRTKWTTKVYIRYEEK